MNNKLGFIVLYSRIPRDDDPGWSLLKFPNLGISFYNLYGRYKLGRHLKGQSQFLAPVYIQL